MKNLIHKRYSAKIEIEEGYGDKIIADIGVEKEDNDILIEIINMNWKNIIK